MPLNVLRCVIIRNILSYQFGALFTGAEILEWAQYQVDTKTSHYKQGKRILRLYNKTLKRDKQYQVYPSYESWSCNDWVHKPLVVTSSKAKSPGKTIC